MNNIRLGDVLIDFGYITQDQLQAALANHGVTTILGASFSM